MEPSTSLEESARSASGGRILRIRSLEKSFDTGSGRNRRSLHVLDRISIDVAQGEFLTVIGPSGCGKSTLLNIVAGLEGYDSGEVEVAGGRVSANAPDIVMIFQEDALFPWLNVQENVEFGLRQRGIPREERATIARQYVEMVGLRMFASSYVHELSGGMKQRVSIARGLALNPRILLMDEPFGALDAKNRDMLQRQIQDIHAQTGKTVIFVTHDVREAVCLGDRVVLFTHAPSRIKREYAVDLPRPRRSEDPALLGLATTVLGDLKEEGGYGEEELGD